MKDLRDLQADAVSLSSLAGGAFELLDGIKAENNAAFNGVYAILRVITEKADQLCDDLDRLDREVKP